MEQMQIDKVTKYIVFDEVVGKLEFVHKAEANAFVEIVELFRTAYHVHAKDPLEPWMERYAEGIYHMDWKALKDSEDSVSFAYYSFNKIHEEVFNSFKDEIDYALRGQLELKLVDGFHTPFGFQCHCPSER